MAGDLDRALADFGRAADEAPHRAAAIYGRGVIAVRQGRQIDGEADINAARTNDPREVAYYEAGGLRP